MDRILFIILIFMLTVYVDGIDVFKSKDSKKIAVYSSIFFTAATLCLLILMDIKIPNPMEAVQTFIISTFGRN